MSSPSIEILIGGSWQLDIRALARLHSFDRLSSQFDFSPILDTIDIVVGENNITSRLREESIFYVMYELVSGLLMLAEGRLDKHIVAFQENAWELAIQRSAHGFELSFYGTGASRQVATHNLLVDSTTFVKVTDQAAIGLLDDLLRINGAFARETLVRSLRKNLHRIRTLAGKLSEPYPDIRVPDEAGSVFTRVGDRKLAIEIEFDASHRDFWRYRGELASDLHSLLFRGSLDLVYWGRRRHLARSGYLFPILEGLVGGAERLLHAITHCTGGCVILDASDGAEGLVMAEVKDADQLVLRITEPGGGTGQTKTTADRLLVLLLDGAAGVSEAMCRLNPRQLLNDRVEDLNARVRAARRQFATVRQGNIYFEQAQEYLEVAPRVERLPPPAVPKGHLPHPFEKLRRLFLRSAWYLARRHIDLGRLTHHGRRLLVPSHKVLECLDRQSGAIEWRIPCDLLLATSRKLVLVKRDHTVAAVDIETACSRWTRVVNGNLWDAKIYLRGGKPTAISIVSNAELVSMDLTRGETEWIFELQHGDIVGFLMAGPVLVIGSDDGYSYGLKPQTGELLWRHHNPGVALIGPIHYRDRLYLCSESEPGCESRFVALSPLTGRRERQLRLPASVSRTPLIVGSIALFVLEPFGASVVVAVDIEKWQALWSLPVQSAALDRTLLMWLPIQPDGLVLIKSDYGLCDGVELRSGRRVWSARLLEPGDILLSNVAPSLVNDQLVVPERYVSIVDPRTGVRLHRFTELPEHPTYLHVDGSLRMVLADGEDHLECFDLRGFLAVV